MSDNQILKKDSAPWNELLMWETH